MQFFLKKKALLAYHFTNRVTFIFTVISLVLSSSTFSNDIACIHFPEHNTGANYDLVSKERRSWVAYPWLVRWPNSVLLIGWGPKFHQHHYRMYVAWLNPSETILACLQHVVYFWELFYCVSFQWPVIQTCYKKILQYAWLVHMKHTCIGVCFVKTLTHI